MWERASDPYDKTQQAGSVCVGTAPLPKLCRLFNQSILKSAVQVLFAVFVAKCFLLLSVQQPCWQHCYHKHQNSAGDCTS